MHIKSAHLIQLHNKMRVVRLFDLTGMKLLLFCCLIELNVQFWCALNKTLYLLCIIGRYKSVWDNLTQHKHVKNSMTDQKLVSFCVCQPIRLSTPTQLGLAIGFDYVPLYPKKDFSPCRLLEPYFFPNQS